MYIPDNDDGAGMSVAFLGCASENVKRSSTFNYGEKKEYKKKEKDEMSGLVNVVHQQMSVSGDSMSMKSEQAYVQCIRALKNSIKEILVREELKISCDMKCSYDLMLML